MAPVVAFVPAVAFAPVVLFVPVVLLVPVVPFAPVVPRLLFDLIAVAGGTGLALLLLWYLHGAWHPILALGCGLISGIVLRRVARPSYGSFPGYLRRPIDTGVVLFGAILTSWATLAREPTSVWLLRWREAVTLPILATVLGLGLVGVVYSHARLRREIEEARAREAALRESALRARLRALQAQINPHFLFNAFNALAELTHADPEVAEQMVGDLAHILRYTLRSSAEGIVHLDREPWPQPQIRLTSQGPLGGPTPDLDFRLFRHLTWPRFLVSHVPSMLISEQSGLEAPVPAFEVHIEFALVVHLAEERIWITFVGKYFGTRLA